MQRILAELNEEVGVKGSAVVTEDGILVTSALSSSMQGEVISALSSFLISTTKRALTECGMEHFGRFIITSTHGKLVLVTLPKSYLVVVADQFINLDVTLLTIQGAAKKLEKMSQINV